ncbi:hypothetical protein [Acaryochloris marina]|uniref:Lipoprotein n=2 Tax=Acaryochloris TaxID=155977 RepID=B0C2P6_ACAM1|nr:hypothetical protein [Acaryochloris marina]ABW30934.1 hypothetical protein AM1_6002 [Acaryochloris marina MBIC11017]BDM79664.1 hypothetical protein AM10699_25320 [Acaryochloris marina MBIC10699]
MKRSKSVELFLALGLSATLFACDGGTTNGEGGEQESPSPAVESPADDGGEGGEDGSTDDGGEGGEDGSSDDGGEGGEGGEG